MSNNKPEIGAGDIPITLGGEEHVLRPSLGAATFLSRQANGLMGVVQKLSTYDMDITVAVVAQGLGLGAPSKDLPEKVWKAGLHEIVPLCIRYVNTLSNGGRPPREAGEEDDDAAPDPQKAGA